MLSGAEGKDWLSQEGLPSGAPVGEAPRDPGAREGGAGRRGAPVNSLQAKQRARISGPPQLGHFCSSEVVGPWRRGVRGAEGNPTPGSQRERPWEGVLLISTYSFQFVCWRSLMSRDGAGPPAPSS